MCRFNAPFPVASTVFQGKTHKMPKDPKLPDRFAKIVLSELADIHALVLCLNDHAIIEQAAAPNRKILDADTAAAKSAFETKRANFADRIYGELLKKLNLSD